MFLTFDLVMAQTAEEFVSTGDQYYKAFNNFDAVKQYEKAYSLNTHNFEILKKLTLTYNDCGEDLRNTDINRAKEFFKKSIKYAELAKQHYPNEPDIHFLLAVSYGNLARYVRGREKVRLARDVEKNLKKMIEVKPDFAPSYIALGIYYRKVAEQSWFLKTFAKTLFGGLPDGTLEDSKVVLKKAVSLDTTIITAHYELAKTYIELKDYENAVFQLNRVIELPVNDHQDHTKKEKAKKKLKKLSI